MHDHVSHSRKTDCKLFQIQSDFKPVPILSIRSGHLDLYLHLLKYSLCSKVMEQTVLSISVNYVKFPGPCPLMA